MTTTSHHSGAPIVALRGVGKTFPSGTVALTGLDLDVREGEFLHGVDRGGLLLASMPVGVSEILSG